MLPEEQRNTGYSIQSFLINVGAVIGSALPFILTNMVGLDNISSEGNVAPSVMWAFYIGATVLLLSVIWTVFRTKEYAPKEYYEMKGIDAEKTIAAQKEESKKPFSEKFSTFLGLVKNMPTTMKQLAIVQFFSWFALYIMWVYTTPAIGQHIWDIAPEYYNMDPKLVPLEISQKMGQAGDWVGIIFAAYSLFAAIYSALMSGIANRFGRKLTYSISLILGGLGYISFLVFQNPEIIHVNLLITEVDIPTGALNLIYPMIGIGVAWAAILAMPYAMLSNALPADKMGIYMGIFNFTIAGPQIISGLLGGWIVTRIFDGNAINMIILAGVSMVLGGFSVYFVKEKE